jgi:hypothetical protein
MLFSAFVGAGAQTPGPMHMPVKHPTTDLYHQPDILHGYHIVGAQLTTEHRVESRSSGPQSRSLNCISLDAKGFQQ